MDRFLNKLAGVAEPEKKRHIIGEEFIDVFAEEARKLEDVKFLAQGTIWPDILESDAGIKAHHNAGGLPDDIADRFELVEPVREEFAKNGLAGKIWQYFTIVPDFKSTGMTDGRRTYEWPVVVRAVNTVDAVTADVAELDFNMMAHIVDRITHEVKGVNRVLWDLTPKPTGTIEWE